MSDNGIPMSIVLIIVTALLGSFAFVSLVTGLLLMKGL
jgi:hypothetical protein